MTIDEAKLIAWLTEKSNTRSPLVASIYVGLANRIARGDFHTKADS